jgi:hypothetical protein
VQISDEFHKGKICLTPVPLCGTRAVRDRREKQYLEQTARAKYAFHYVSMNLVFQLSIPRCVRHPQDLSVPSYKSLSVEKPIFSRRASGFAEEIFLGIIGRTVLKGVTFMWPKDLIEFLE